jgi:hypothetical protein
LRYFTSHPALVEPTYISHQVLRPLAPGITGVEQSTTVQEKLEIEDTPAPYYFCRLCRNSLVEPRIGDVRAIRDLPFARSLPPYPFPDLTSMST